MFNPAKLSVFFGLIIIVSLSFSIGGAKAVAGGGTAEASVAAGATSEIGASLNQTAPATSEVSAAPTAPEAKASAKSIKWLTSLEDALTLSRETKKMVMVDVVTGWCGWCRKMDRDTYSDKEVIELCSAYVCLRANPEEDQTFASKFQVNEFPAVLFLKSDGTEADRLYGYKIPSEFKRSVSSIAENLKSKNK